MPNPQAGYGGTLSLATINVAGIEDWSLSTDCNLLEASLAGTQAKNYVAGETEATFTANCWWDDTLTKDPYDMGIIPGASVAISLVPYASGPAWTGTLMIENLTPSGSRAGKTMFSVTGKIDGALAIANFTS